MLEKYISNLLVPYLCKYAENVDPKQLNISLWKGSASLKDLVLRADVLDALIGGGMELPLRLHRGVCKSILFDIPITDINSKPLEAKVASVLLCFTVGGNAAKKGRSRADVAEAAAAEKKRAFEQKEAALNEFEEERKRKTQEKEEALQDEKSAAKKKAAGGGGVLSRLSERVINNVIVRIESVHIRIENLDTQTCFASRSLRQTTVAMQRSSIRPTSSVYTNVAHSMAWRCTVKQWTQKALQQLSHRRQCFRLWPTTRRGSVRCSSGCRYRRATVVAAPSPSLPQPSLDLSQDPFELLQSMQQHLKKLQHLPYLDATVELDNVVASSSRAQYSTILTEISRWSHWKLMLPLQQCRDHLAEAKAQILQKKGNAHDRARALWAFVRTAIRTLSRRPVEKILRQRASAVAWSADYEALYEKKILSGLSTAAQQQRPAAAAAATVPLPPQSKDDIRLQACIHQMLVPDLISARKRVYKRLATELSKKRQQDALAAAAAAKVAPEEKPKKSGGLFGFFGFGGGDDKKDAKDAPPTLEAIEREYGLDSNLEDDDYESVKASL
ncbi:Hypothetical protein, putative, partial [Bodo saltans]